MYKKIVQLIFVQI